MFVVLVRVQEAMQQHARHRPHGLAESGATWPNEKGTPPKYVSHADGMSCGLRLHPLHTQPPTNKQTDRQIHNVEPRRRRVNHRDLTRQTFVSSHAAAPASFPGPRLLVHRSFVPLLYGSFPLRIVYVPLLPRQRRVPSKSSASTIHTDGLGT